ncbi:uncharacterized protein LOC127866616 [Dreissena polymorpha]|uniref:Uncharacterized protein n=1 Tax=Dreissena polymorpha TaxID=45954 RepID=A0A9D4LRT3_DREPO|nr:uncharacterized protein LOC127866616 [Dreissena polymorpha]KAH3863705.1 hypothetical protein DPMN_026695 [Dreissena polymorpha]
MWQRQDHLIWPNLEVKVNFIHKTTINESGNLLSTKSVQVGSESNYQSFNEQSKDISNLQRGNSLNNRESNGNTESDIKSFEKLNRCYLAKSSMSQKCSGFKRKSNKLESSSFKRILKVSNNTLIVKATNALRRGCDNINEIKTERSDGVKHIKEKITKIPFHDKKRHDSSMSRLKYTEPVPLVQTAKTASNNNGIVDNSETSIAIYPEQSLQTLKLSTDFGQHQNSDVILSKESNKAEKLASTNTLQNTCLSTQIIGKEVASVDWIVAAGKIGLHLTDCNDNFQRTQMRFLPTPASMIDDNKTVTSMPNSQTGDMEVKECQNMSCNSTRMDIGEKPIESEKAVLTMKIEKDKCCQNELTSQEKQLKEVNVYSDTLNKHEVACATEQNTDIYMSKSVAQSDVINDLIQNASKSLISDFDISPSLPLDDHLFSTCLKDVFETGQQDVNDLLHFETVFSPKLFDFIQNKTVAEKENVSRYYTLSPLDLQEPDINISPLLTYGEELYLKNSIKDVEIKTDLWKNNLQNLGESNMKLPLDTGLLSSLEEIYTPEIITYCQEKRKESIGKPRTYQYGKHFQRIKAMSKSLVPFENVEKLIQSEEKQSCENIEKSNLLKKKHENMHSCVSIKSVNKIVQECSVKMLGIERKTKLKSKRLKSTTKYDKGNNRNIHKIGEECLKSLMITKIRNKKSQPLQKTKAKSDTSNRKDKVTSSNIKEGSFSNFGDHEKSLDLLDTGCVINDGKFQINNAADVHLETQTIKILDQDSAQLTSLMLTKKPQRNQDTKSCSGRINKTKANMLKFNRIVEVFCSQSKLMLKKSNLGQKSIQSRHDDLHECGISKDCEREIQICKKPQNKKEGQIKVSREKLLTPITVKPKKPKVAELTLFEPNIRNICNEMKCLRLSDNNLNVNMNSNEVNAQNSCSKSGNQEGSLINKKKKIFTCGGEIVKDIEVSDTSVVGRRTLKVHLIDILTRPQFVLSCSNNSKKQENPSRSSKLKDKTTKFKSEEGKRREKLLAVKASYNSSNTRFQKSKTREK